jgi:hypothetical protein
MPTVKHRRPAALRHFVLEAVIAALRLTAMLSGTAPAVEAVTPPAPPSPPAPPA